MSQPAADSDHHPISPAAVSKTQKPSNAKADCCNYILFLLLLAALVGAVPAVTRLLVYLQPSLPIVAVVSSAVTVTNVSASLVTASWDVTFSIANPNAGGGFFYDRLVAYAAAGADGRLANATFEPFRQGGGGASTLTASFRSLKFVVNDCAANRTIRKPCGPAELSLEVEPLAVYERWTWPERRNLVEVECDVMKVVFRPNTRKFELGPSSCRSDGEWRRLKEKYLTVFWDYVYVAGFCFVILAVSQ